MINSFRKSITFNGHHPEEYGAVLSSITTTIPAPRQITDTVPYRDGVYNFSRFDGSLHYDNRTVTCVFHIVASDTDELYDKLRKVTDWLYSDGENTLYDDRDIFWHFEDVFCTGIETEFLLNDKTAIQVTATMSANPYKISNSGIVVNALTIKPSSDSSSYYLIYRPSDSNVGLRRTNTTSSDTKIKFNTDSNVKQISVSGTTVTMELNSDWIAGERLVGIGDYLYGDDDKTRVVTNVYFQIDGDVYQPELYDNDEFLFLMYKYDDKTTRVIFELVRELSTDELSTLWFKRLTVNSKSGNIGFEVAPLSIKTSALPTITLYKGLYPDSSSAKKTYVPGAESIDISEGIYRIVIDNAKSKEVTFVYDSTTRRL